MNKILFNIIIQIIALYFLGKHYIENASPEFNEYLFSGQTLLLVLFLCLPKIIHVINFYYILKILIKKKINFFSTSEIFLNGGIINQLIPGLGFIYKYKKLKDNQKIDLNSYICSQTLWSILSVVSYLLFAFCFGVIIFKNIFYLNLLIIFIIIISISLFFFNKKILFLFLKLKKFIFFKNLFMTLSLFRSSLKKIFLIFLFFLFLTFFECISFYFGINFLSSISLDFYRVILTYITTVITNYVVIFHFFGVFETIFTVSANMILFSSNENFLMLAISWRLINTFSLILIAFIFTILNKYFYKNY